MTAAGQFPSEPTSRSWTSGEQLASSLGAFGLPLPLNLWSWYLIAICDHIALFIVWRTNHWLSRHFWTFSKLQSLMEAPHCGLRPYRLSRAHPENDSQSSPLYDALQRQFSHQMYTSFDGIVARGGRSGLSPRRRLTALLQVVVVPEFLPIVIRSHFAVVIFRRTSRCLFFSSALSPSFISQCWAHITRHWPIDDHC